MKNGMQKQYYARGRRAAVAKRKREKFRQMNREGRLIWREGVQPQVQRGRPQVCPDRAEL